MFVCLLLAVLLLFHTNSFSFSFLLNSILILIFTNKSQDSCLFKMPPAFLHSLAWSCSCECCSSQQLMASVGGDLRAQWPFQNIRPKWKGAPASQARPLEGINITLHRFTAKLKEGSCWRQDRRGIFLSVFFCWWELEMELARNKCWWLTLLPSGMVH